MQREREGARERERESERKGERAPERKREKQNGERERERDREKMDGNRERARERARAQEGGSASDADAHKKTPAPHCRDHNRSVGIGLQLYCRVLVAAWVSGQ